VTQGLVQETWQTAAQVAEVAASITGASPGTIRNLIRAANRAGLMDVRRATGGEPARIRAYVRWRPTRPTPDPRGDLS
jgi:hypothetical protein